MAVISACVFAAMMHAEGLRLRRYYDHGSWAIGFGHHGEHVPRRATRAQSVQWLIADIAEADECVEDLTQGTKMTPGQHDALVDFCFNAGCGALQKSALLRKFKRGDRAGAAREFSRWIHSGHHIHAGLVRRRAMERRLFEGKGCGKGAD